MERNIKLVIEYDGSNYHGWQIQKNSPTIQGTIKKSIEILTGENITLYGAGRTDSGVHAYNQIANFYTSSKIPAKSFHKALNSKLPSDITIKKADEVSFDFHSQYYAKSKIYEYKIVCRDTRPAIAKNYANWVNSSLDIQTMKEGSKYLIGTHDFLSFQAANSPRKSTIRTLNYIDILKDSCYIYIVMEANGYLYKMVRNIVGTLIDVGKNIISPEQVKIILEAKDRKLCSPTATANGLYLKFINYQKII